MKLPECKKKETFSVNESVELADQR